MLWFYITISEEIQSYTSLFIKIVHVSFYASLTYEFKTKLAQLPVLIVIRQQLPFMCLSDTKLIVQDGEIIRLT